MPYLLDTDSPVPEPSDSIMALSPLMHASPPEPAAASPGLSHSPAGAAAAGLDLESPSGSHDCGPSCDQPIESKEEEAAPRLPSLPRPRPYTKQTMRLSDMHRVEDIRADRRQTPCLPCLEYLANYPSPSDTLVRNLPAVPCGDDKDQPGECFRCRYLGKACSKAPSGLEDLGRFLQAHVKDSTRGQRGSLNYQQLQAAARLGLGRHHENVADQRRHARARKGLSRCHQRIRKHKKAFRQRAIQASKAIRDASL